MKRLHLKRFRDLSLGFKLWLLFLCFIVPCILALGFSFWRVLDYTRDEEIFKSITDAQKLLSSGKTAGTSAYDSAISVYHIGIVDRKVKYMTFPTEKYGVLLTPLIDRMGTGFAGQKSELQKYKFTTQDYALYYVIRKTGQDGVISFKIDVPMDRVYRSSFVVLVIFTATAVALAILFSLVLLRALMRPLGRFEKSLARMAEGDLQTPVLLDRGDEIGRLSREAEAMRRELARRDVTRQSALQYVSHELKTPIMTIASYAQALLDHVYPRGTMEESVGVILDETRRMQQMVLKLISLSRLDYLENRPRHPGRVELKELCGEVAARICGARPELSLELALEEVSVLSYRDQLEVMLENLLENAVRHADGVVRVQLKQDGGGAVFTLFNDGGGIDEKLMPVLFEAFHKGGRGVTGLGLSIVRRAVRSCGGSVLAENVEDGVRFTVRLPAEPPVPGTTPREED